MKYYKVVNNKNGKLLSAVLSKLDSLFTVEYKLNEWVYPLTGKLFAFNSLEYAKEFFKNEKSTENISLYEAEVENPIEREIVTIPDDAHILMFWGDCCREAATQVFSPLGTVLCDKIKLIKKIDEQIL